MPEPKPAPAPAPALQQPALAANAPAAPELPSPIMPRPRSLRSSNRSHQVPGITADEDDGHQVLANGDTLNLRTGEVIAPEYEEEESALDGRRQRDAWDAAKCYEYASTFTPSEQHQYADVFPAFADLFRAFAILMATSPRLNSNIKQHVHALLSFLGWRWTTVGAFSTIEETLDSQTINAYVRSRQEVSKASVSSYRGKLRRIALTLAPTIYRPEAISGRTTRVTLPNPPYTDTEMRLLERRARQDLTGPAQREALALINLGRGAGLDGKWAADVTADDVVIDDETGIVKIFCRDPQRYVPVVKPYDKAIREITEQLRSDGHANWLLMGYPPGTHRNAANQPVARFNQHLETVRSRHPGVPDLCLARLRNTWLLDHLQGLGLKEVLAAAGIITTLPVERLLDYVQPMPAPKAAAHLTRHRR